MAGECAAGTVSGGCGGIEKNMRIPPEQPQTDTPEKRSDLPSSKKHQIPQNGADD